MKTKKKEKKKRKSSVTKPEVIQASMLFKKIIFTMTDRKTRRKLISRLYEPQHVPLEDGLVAHSLTFSKNTPIIFFYY
jgi:hypothetical protein